MPVEKYAICTQCYGTGSRLNGAMCDACLGSGRVPIPAGTAFSFDKTSLYLPP